MNLTILLALVAAWFAVVILKRIVGHLLLRRVGREALAEVGRRALTRLPEYVSLLPVEHAEFTNPDAMRQQSEPLAACGFQDAGVYSVAQMPGVLIRMMAQPETGVAAHIHDHPRQGSWLEMVSRYDDGSTQAVLTMTPTGLKAPSWFHRIYADKSIPTDQIYKRFVAQRPQKGIRQVPVSRIVREFEEVYHRLAQWRQEAGITPQEVAHVAVKWAEKKKVNAAGI